MVNILVMTHGEMAKGMHNTVEMVIGKQDNFLYHTFDLTQSLDSLVNTLKEKITQFSNNLPCLILVDLFGGSPCNAVAYLLGEGYQVQAVAGVNLPMLITALTERDSLSLKDLVGKLLLDGQNGIINITERFMEN